MMVRGLVPVATKVLLPTRLSGGDTAGAALLPRSHILGGELSGMQQGS